MNLSTRWLFFQITGPAGTGKTESVKALGHQLGRFVLVFNCDETFDFQVRLFSPSQYLKPLSFPSQETQYYMRYLPGDVLNCDRVQHTHCSQLDLHSLKVDCYCLSKIVIACLCVYLCVWDWVSLCSPGWPRTHSPVSAGLAGCTAPCSSNSSPFPNQGSDPEFKC